jgi:hypothetical protein
VTTGELVVAAFVGGCVLISSLTGYVAGEQSD